MKMKRTSFFQILVISCLFLTFFIVNEVDGAKLEDSLKSLIHSVNEMIIGFQEMSVRNVDTHRETLQHLLEKMEKASKTGLQQLKREVIEEYKKFIDALKERREQNKEERIKEWEDFKNTFAKLYSTAETRFAIIERDLGEFLSSAYYMFSGENIHLKSKVEKVEKALAAIKGDFNSEISKFKNSFERLFKKVEKHGGIAHKPHEKLISCGGKTYTLHEFLDEFDSAHNLLIIEEDFWNDHDLEEFYEGWDVWAKKMGLKCNKGQSDWKAVAVPKEEL